MGAERFLMIAAGALAAFAVAAGAWLVPSQDALASAQGAPSATFLGVASCAGSTCHGRGEADGAVVRQDEIMIWQDPASAAGAHSRAWSVLREPRSRAIAQRLGIGDAASAPMCLGCHATPAPAGRRGPRFQLSDGVGCEGCHGAASPWLASHYAVGGTHADKLGLAQLYQLRGRVGRAGEQAYAYLFYPANVRLTETAHERLKTLARYTELGSGMAIAMRDLEIRGAGNLLGAEQHGHIEAVGFEMYMQLLEEAAREMKGEEPAPAAEVRIDLPVDAYLPESYITESPLRLAAYRRIAEATTSEEVADVCAELRDRFGPLPEVAEALCEVAELRVLLWALGVTEVQVAPHELHGRVAKLRPVAFEREWQHVRLAREHPRAVLSEATSTLILPAPATDGRELVAWLSGTLRGLLERDIVPA
jgi:hypothetical protein